MVLQRQIEQAIKHLTAAEKMKEAAQKMNEEAQKNVTRLMDNSESLRNRLREGSRCLHKRICTEAARSSRVATSPQAAIE